jgi:chromate transporter
MTMADLSRPAAVAEGYQPGVTIPFSEAVKVWARVAALSFGGPAGQIAVMHRILVEEKRWIGEHRFLHALNYCMLLPGPEAQQLAVYIGWLLHRTKGGIVAGLLFILPGFLSILALSYLYVTLGHLGAIAGLFFGLKAAVLAIVLQAVVRIGKRALKNRVMVGIAVAAFIGIFAFDVPFPLIVAAAALVGYVGARAGSPLFRIGGGHAAGKGPVFEDAHSLLGEATPMHARPNLGWSLSISGVLLALWLGPMLALLLLLGPGNVFSQIAVFFSQMAVVTFGGAYAVLAYVAQEAVQNYGWLMPGEMLDGLGMAETTPGPLIMVVQFVGFLGGYRDPGSLDPMLAAGLAAILTTWVTFVPCFLWIFLGAPFIEQLRGNVALTGALSAVTAAVVGVIANLAVWFAVHALFAQTTTWQGLGLSLDIPAWATVNLPALVLTVAAVLAVFRFNIGTVWVLLGCAAAGVAWLSLAG